MITLIAAMARNKIIGENGVMPWHLPEDLQFFKKTTMNKPMIMGRKTRESFGKKPLPNRPHLVITRNQEYQALGSDIFFSIDDALYAAQKINEDIFIIGGANIYKQTLPYANRLLLSEIQQDFEGDCFFPEFNLDKCDKKTLFDYENASIPFIINEYIIKP